MTSWVATRDDGIFGFTGVVCFSLSLYVLEFRVVQARAVIDALSLTSKVVVPVFFVPSRPFEI